MFFLATGLACSLLYYLGSAYSAFDCTRECIPDPKSPVRQIDTISLQVNRVLDSPCIAVERKVVLLEMLFRQHGVVNIVNLTDGVSVLWHDNGCAVGQIIKEVTLAIQGGRFNSGDLVEAESTVEMRVLYWQIVRNVSGKASYVVGLQQFPFGNSAIIVELVKSFELHDGLVTKKKEQFKLLDGSIDGSKASKHPALVSSLCHDVRTPLATISALATLLEDEKDEICRLRQSKLIRLYAAMASELLGGLVATDLFDDTVDTRKGGGERRLPVAEVVEELYGLFFPLAEEKGLSFDLQSCRAAERYSIAENSFRRLLLNILSNAFKFTRQGGVTIRVYEANECLAVEIEDTGVGMSGEQLAILGQSYQRFSDTSIDGLGVGMTIVRQLSDFLGLELQVASQQGRGTKISFQVFRSEPQPIFGSAVHVTASKLVVIADDDEVYCRSLGRALEQLGFRTILIHDTRELQAIAWFERPDAIISDYCFANCSDGCEDRWRNIPTSIPIIALTGDVSVETADRLRAWGAVAVLSKPVHASRLKNVIDVVVGERSGGASRALSRNQSFLTAA